MAEEAMAAEGGQGSCLPPAAAWEGPRCCTRLSRAVILILLVLPAVGWTRKSGSVHVHGYTTRSGHYVAPYTRSAPHTYHAPALPRSSHPSTRNTSLSGHPSTRAAA